MPSCQQVICTARDSITWCVVHIPADKVVVSTRTRPRAVGMDAWYHGRDARALKAAASCVGWCGSDRDRSLSPRAAWLQKSVFEVLVKAEAASDDPTPAERSDCGVISGRYDVSHDFRSALERRAPPMPLNTVYGPVSIITSEVACG